MSGYLLLSGTIYFSDYLLLGYLDLTCGAFYSLSLIPLFLFLLITPDPFPPPKAGAGPELSLLKLKSKVFSPPLCSRSS